MRTDPPALPLPLAPPPWRAEALHSWLRRMAAPYKLSPRQLLHAIGVPTFAGPSGLLPQGPVQGTLTIIDLQYLARLARCDPSRLGINRTSLARWMLIDDNWIVICPRCLRLDLTKGATPYERAGWRLTTLTFCPQHRTPLVLLESMALCESELAECDQQQAPFSDLEIAVASELLAFEHEIVAATRGIAPKNLNDTLNAAEFLDVLMDLTTFVVGIWPAENNRSTSCLEQHTSRIRQHACNLFSCRRPRGQRHARWPPEQLQLNGIADPATRRAALWLVMHVIRLPPTPRPKHALRLGFTAQDDLFGSIAHEGWGWLKDQAQRWPAAYREHYWEGFVRSSPTSKGTSPTFKGTKSH